MNEVMIDELLKRAVMLAGVGELILVLGSFFIPKCLDWKTAMGRPNNLLRQLFWTYAGYILVIHFFFGVMSIWAVDDLMKGGRLAVGLSMLMMCWWVGRLVLQFFCFDRSCIPKNRFNVLAEGLLVCLFVYLSAVYGILFWRVIG